MDPKDTVELAARVAQAAAAALEARGYVSAIDLMKGLGWLTQARVDEWRQRRIPFLEAGIPTHPARVSSAMSLFAEWVAKANLKPSETGYVAGRQPLRFTQSGAPELERAYRTHWLSPELLVKKPPPIVE